MRTGSFREIEHTADIGLEVVAPDYAALFATAAEALFSQLADLSVVRPISGPTVAVEALDRSDLLVSWLSELLYLHCVEGWLFVAYRDLEASDDRLVAHAVGERYDPARHVVHTEIKAVTHHLAAVEPRADHWWARFILDH